jgi:hypothetical protein
MTPLKLLAFQAELFDHVEILGSDMNPSPAFGTFSVNNLNFKNPGSLFQDSTDGDEVQ